jgi:precorrin-6A/cobalt-precorrin-6A reductase
MILLLGGTTEARILCEEISSKGLPVIYSTVTGIQELGNHQGLVSRIFGPLDFEKMERLIVDRGIRVIVDATHPYAEQVHLTAGSVALKLGVPLYRWRRPECIPPLDFVHFADSHNEAAKLAVTFARPILLTIGSKNVAPYVNACRIAEIRLVVRVLPSGKSVDYCLSIGVSREDIIQGMGPFSVQENLKTITNFNIGVIVAKDSGLSGGSLEKIEAARLSGIVLVVVKRPVEENEDVVKSMPELVETVRSILENSQKLVRN